MTLTLDLNLPQLSHHRVHYTEASADFSHCGHYRYRLTSLGARAGADVHAEWQAECGASALRPELQWPAWGGRPITNPNTPRACMLLHRCRP